MPAEDVPLALLRHRLAGIEREGEHLLRKKTLMADIKKIEQVLTVLCCTHSSNTSKILHYIIILTVCLGDFCIEIGLLYGRMCPYIL